MPSNKEMLPLSHTLDYRKDQIYSSIESPKGGFLLDTIQEKPSKKMNRMGSVDGQIRK
jgi:hypothetical protein